MRAPWRRNEGTPGEPSVPSAVARFAVAGIVAVALVGLVSFLVMRSIGTAEATDNAGEVTELIGAGIVEPNLTQAVIDGDPDALARFDRIIGEALNDQIVRVKLWNADGKIVYSDEPRLIGNGYDLGAEERKTLEEGTPDAEVSDLEEPENQYERDQGKLLEAYSRVEAPNGDPLLFESYQQYSSVTSSGESLWVAFAPALIGALILLELVQLPLATSLARRVRGAHRERVTLLERAVDASERERRRIAGDLHDGTVQDLAGVALSLEGAARRVDDRDPDAAASLRSGAAHARESVRSLRNLLVEIYPPSLQREGLEAALEDVLAPLSARGVETSLDYDAAAELSVEQQALCLRVAQEAARNVLKHAGASNVSIQLEGAELTIADDGRGFDPGAAPSAKDGDGHIGTDLLRDLAEEAGAELEFESAPGTGTVVRLRLPPS